MKSFYFLLLLFLLTLSAQAQIIDIPDTNFKQALLNASLSNGTARDINFQNIIIDSNNDNEIQISEALDVYYLEVSNENINSLTGIEEFLSLGTLYCSNNNLTSVDLSSLTNLKGLGISNNQLTTLDVSNLVLLDGLSCAGNNLSELDISALTNLETLRCSSNNLSNLNLSNNPDLRFLNCGSNQLAAMDLSGLSELYTFWCDNNSITSLDFSETPALTFIQCENNNLLELDISPINELYVLHTAGNVDLVSINIKNMVIPAGGNIDFENCPSLQYICADAEDISRIENAIDGYGYANCYTNTLCTFVENEPYFRIEGQVIFDENNDGCDDDDTFRPDYLILSDGSNTGDILADELGNYHMNVQANTYELMPFFSNGDYYSVSPPMAVVNFPSQGSPFVQDFCVTSGGDFTDLSVTFLEIDSFFFGETNEFTFEYFNQGSITQSGSITFSYDDEVATFTESSENTTSQTAGTISWDFVDIQPFETRSISVTFDMNGPSDNPPLNEGDILSFAVQIQTTSADETPTDNADMIDVAATENTLSVEVYEFANFFRFFPNPATSEIYLESKRDTKVQTVEVFNLYGQRIRSKKPQASNFMLDINDLAKGLYIIRLETELGVMQSKFIKK